MIRVRGPTQLLRLVQLGAVNDGPTAITQRLVNRRRNLHISAARICKDAVVKLNEKSAANSPLIDLQGKWPTAEQDSFLKDMRIIPDFLSAEEEAQLLEEIEPYMKRLHYEYDHWDDAIHGFRETERKQWYPHNRTVLERVRHVAFEGAVMPFVHVLDLAEEGVIKPHVDSTRYCGNTIAGISLLSDAVMRLIRTEEHKYKQRSRSQPEFEATAEDVAQAQGKDDADAYRSHPQTTLVDNFYADLLLPRRSLYIMSHTSRYNFTHEVLSNKVAQFRGRAVKKERRISIICRNEP